MARKMVSKFEVYDDLVTISRDVFPELVLTTYREDYYEELKSLTWSLKNDYVYSNKIKKYLHQYIMEKWYGEDTVKDLYSKGWIIEHMDNNGFNCQIENLGFLSKDRNTSKAFGYDKERRNNMGIGINVFKDFSTNCYQITVAFSTTVIINDTVIIIDDGLSNKGEQLNGIRLLYDSNKKYISVISDADKILIDFKEYGKVNLDKLEFDDYEKIPAIYTNIPKGGSKDFFIKKIGDKFVIGGEKVKLQSIGYRKGWQKKE